MKNLIMAVIVLGTIMLTGINQEAQAQIVVIVNNDNSTENMSAGKVKLYYLRKIKKRWPSNNASIKPVNLKGGSAKTSFLGLLKMADSEMAQYFKQRQFANAEAPPVNVASESEMIKYVSENAGAIGYVSKATYDANSSKVKAVLTQ